MWHEKHIASISQEPVTAEELQLILSLIDLTSLEGTENQKTITALCEKAKKYGAAAVCIYPDRIPEAKKALKGTNIKIAAVESAFPTGNLPLDHRLKEVTRALGNGADEIDMVISRQKFLEGDHDFVRHEVSSFKKECVNKTLKAILETGELQSTENIRIASEIAIESGADFIKTSTGKIKTGASLEAVCTMLIAIKNSGKKIGIKPSGGIADAETAVKYLRLTEKILGKEWLTPALFRFGASRLADHVFSRL